MSTDKTEHIGGRSRAGFTGQLAAAWGIAGFILLLGRGIARLLPPVLDLPLEDFSSFHWFTLVLSVVAFGIGEGYLAIQRSYVPRLVERADALRRNPTLLYGLLAPLYAMGLIGGPTGTVVRSWSMVAAIILMILGMQFVPDPWHGIILAGVVVALIWAGLVCLAAGLRLLTSS